MRNHLAAKSAARGKSVDSSRRSRRSITAHSKLSRSTEYRSFIEPLEARQLLSATVIEVTTTQDIVDPNDGLISLREAILTANQQTQANYDIKLGAGPYLLTRQGSNEDAGLTGDLDVTTPAKVRVLRERDVIIDAAGLFNSNLGYGDRIFDIHPGANFEIQNGTLINGHAPDTGVSTNKNGGAIRSTNARLFLVDSRLFDNFAPNSGGAISAEGGSLETYRVEFARNEAVADGGAVFSATQQTKLWGSFLENSANRGGALFNSGTVTGNGVFRQNTASVGGAIATFGPLSLSQSSLIHNSAGFGGAISISGNATTILNSTITGNLAANGGAIAAEAGSITISGSNLAGNYASSEGGAIFTRGALNVSTSVLTGNLADRGGAILWANGLAPSADQFSLSDSQVIANQARLGAGVFVQEVNYQRLARIANTSFTLNNATTQGGGLFVSSRVSTIADVEVRDSIFNENTATYGGAIYNTGSVSVLRTSFTENHARGNGGALMHIQNIAASRISLDDSRFVSNSAGGNGGAVSSFGAGLTVSESLFDSNQAGNGGALHMDVLEPREGYFAVIDRSTFANNQAFGDGGAVYSDGAYLIANSTLTGNEAKRGGGIYTNSDSATLVVNSTLSGNAATQSGGGLHNANSASLRNSTIVFNRAPVGGGAFGIQDLRDTIVAGNRVSAAPNSAPNDLGASNSFNPAGFNIIGDPATAGGLTNGVNGNLVGNGSGGVLDISTVLDTTLADNGGPTLTHALLVTGPAVNAGDPAFDPNAFDPPLNFDQRGTPFPRVFGGRVDIGAFEATDPLPIDGVIIVTTFDDIVAVDGLWSLREAVLWANAHPEDNQIVLAVGTYNLTRQGSNEDAGLTGDLDVVANGSLKILGAGSDHTTIDASGLFNDGLGYGDRIFDVFAGANVTLQSVQLVNGKVDTDGGAIRIASASVSLTSTQVTATSAANRGGGVFVDSASSLSLQNTSINANTAGTAGGGIFNLGQMSLDQSVVAQNTSPDGGAIYHESNLAASINASQIFENNATDRGGAIAAFGPLKVTGSTFNDNSAGRGGAIFNAGSVIEISGGAMNRNGAVLGGAVMSELGSVNISGALVAGNHATSRGGAINVSGDLLVTGTTLTGNISRGDGGAIYSTRDLHIADSTLSSNVSEQGSGGAISWLPEWISGVLKLENVEVEQNRALHGGGLQTLAHVSGAASISNSTFSENKATARGGAIDAYNEFFPLEITTSAFQKNVANVGGAIRSAGGLQLTKSNLRQNEADLGGGLHLSGSMRGPSVIAEVVLADNRARLGGGIYNQAASWFDGDWVRVAHSTLTGNIASESGGAFYNVSPNVGIDSSTLSGNVAAQKGGALFGSFFRPGYTTDRISNSTLSQNTAGTDGGAIYVSYGIDLSNSTLILNRADADGNGSGTGGGISIPGLSGALVTNSIIAGNVTGAAGSNLPSEIALAGGALNPASRFNLIGDPGSAGGMTNGLNGNIVGDGFGGVLDISTVLDTTLANNGGVTLTHALLPTSPAVNTGDPSLDANAFPFDQRGAGYARATGGRVDIGAFELGSEFQNAVYGRRVFYNNSAADFANSLIDSLDIFAIDPTKQALLPNGSLADSSNITSYSRGINGIMIDLAGSHPNITVDDFIFRVGANNDPACWAAAPAPSDIQVLPAQGVGGGDRVVIIWPDGAIVNTYLQVIALANEDTGLDEPDVFFFGNRVGDTFNTQPAESFTTTAADELAARSASPKLFLPITNPYDFDKSGTITAADQLISRANVGVLRRIQIVPPMNASPLAVPAVGQSIAALSAASVSSSATNTLVSGLATRASSSVTDLPQDAAAAGTLQQQASPAVRPSAPALFAAVDKVFGAPSASGSSESADTWDDLLDELIPALA